MKGFKVPEKISAEHRASSGNGGTRVIVDSIAMKSPKDMQCHSMLSLQPKSIPAAQDGSVK